MLCPSTQCGTQQATSMVGLLSSTHDSGFRILKNKVTNMHQTIMIKPSPSRQKASLSPSSLLPHQDSECYSGCVMPRSEIDLNILSHVYMFIGRLYVSCQKIYPTTTSFMFTQLLIIHVWLQYSVNSGNNIELPEPANTIQVVTYTPIASSIYSSVKQVSQI